MSHFTDAQVQGLFFLAADAEEPMINDMQREAIRQLGHLSRQGNREAQAALAQLTKRDLHPLLREMALGELGIPVPRRAMQAS